MPPDSGEASLKAANLQIAQRTLAGMDKAAADEEAFKASPLYGMQTELETKATQNLLDRITGKAPVLSPEEQSRLDQIYSQSEKTGMDSISRYAQEQASARGMSTADSPIGNETLRQIQEFQSSLGANKSQAALNLGDANAQFNSGLAQLQANLRQQSFQNQLSLASTAPASYGLENSLFTQRLAAAPKSYRGMTDATNWGANVDVYKLLSAAGSAYGGA